MDETSSGRIDELFSNMVKFNASDLHVKAGSPPVYRVDGQLRRTKAEELSAEEIEALVGEWLGEGQVARLRKEGSLDVGHDFEGGRVRVNIFLQRGYLSLAARLVKSKIPTLDELHLPPALQKIIEFNQGLALVCGVTGCGKSTTLACLIEAINEHQSKHIITLEDPIEFLHKDKKSIINQREMGLDCHSWPDALRAAVREDPDVILVGEMRDHETFQAGLIASETGHLVFGTLHTSSVAGTIGRILDLFPPDKHRLIRQSLGFNLKAVACQKLVPSYRQDVDRVPAVEFMLVNPPIQKAIETGEDGKIADMIAQGEQEGMQSWTSSFVRLIKEGYVERSVAREFAPNRHALEMALRGIGVSHGSFS